MKTSTLAAVLFGTVVGLVALGATPPALINYQGVLRSATDAPLTGTYDIVFRFFDGISGGNEILVDSHTAGGANAVSVTGGLFNVQLGSGTVTDGSGAGTYTSLADVFRDYTAIYLEVQIGAETLAPRTQVTAAAYAMNATNLGGRPSTQFLDTSDAFQTKFAGVTLDLTANYSTLPALQVYGANGGLPGGSWASLGNLNYGLQVFGHDSAAYFFSGIADSTVTLSTSDGVGVNGQGRLAGGFFADRDGYGHAFVGVGDRGIEAYGTNMGGFFKDFDQSGEGWAGVQDTGFQGYGTFAGGYFQDTDNGSWAEIGAGGYSIYAGTGTKAFVQNHPKDKDKSIVYSALEGDEAGTYTRGTARLVHGEARVRLGETFQWVTNPDIGLTAYVTPVGAWTDLYVESKSTTELIVKSRDPRAPDTTFDYMVYGLRIGFEELAIVQEKHRDSVIPRMNDLLALYARHPELRGLNALERFKSMRKDIGLTEAIDLTASTALHDAIGVYDPDVMGPRQPPADSKPGVGAAGPAGLETGVQITGARPTSAPGAARTIAIDRPSQQGAVRPLNLVAVSVPVATGDVLVVDQENPGMMHLGSIAGDPTLVGIVVAADPTNHIGPGEAPLALAGTVVPCKVDATTGAIHIGDLLTVSATPGHAMRSIDPVPGTIVGKALAEIETGTGVIDVLVMLR